MPTLFKTLKKHNVIIVAQPYMYTEKYLSGNKKGKVKAKRQVRYVDTLDTVFVDEQNKLNPRAKQTPVYIKKSNITVQDEDPQLLEFFKMHPDNVENGGNLFREVDVEKEDLFQIEKYEALDEARKHIMTADEDALRAAAVFFVNHTYLTQPISKIKIKLRNSVEMASQDKKDPLKFVQRLNDFFNDKNNSEKLAITVALKERIIEISGGKKFVWEDSKEGIYIASQARDAIQEFALWLKNDEQGRQALSSISKKIEQLRS